VIQILNSLDKHEPMMVLDNAQEKSPKQSKFHTDGSNSSKAPQIKSIYQDPGFQQPYVIDAGVSDETDTLKPHWWKRLGSIVMSAYKKTKDKMSLTYEEAKLWGK
jgi:SPX domain protein involved in polyphosphate accumulation